MIDIDINKTLQSGFNKSLSARTYVRQKLVVLQKYLTDMVSTYKIEGQCMPCFSFSFRDNS